MNRRIVVVAACSVGAIVVAHIIDWWSLTHLAMPRLAESDLGRMLRVLGFVPLWLCVAIAIAVSEDPGKPWRSRMKRGALVVLAAAVGGIVAELAKVLIRRERPDASVSEYVFRPWSIDPLSTGGLGLPSSHALVAFAALAMMSYLFPGARYLWIVLGVGCAYTRVASGAHFVSDVVVSAVMGYAVAWLIKKRWFSRQPRPAHVDASLHSVPATDL